MYISIRRYRTNLKAELTRRVQQEFGPLISKAPGFLAYYALDAEGDVWASVSIFETQAQAEESNRLAADWVNTAMGSRIGQPELTAGNVVAQQEILAQKAA